MNIDRQNYEAYFLDYIEGNLNAAEIARLMDFLVSNPDLKAELENYEPVTLAPETNIYTEKDTLKKNRETKHSVYESNFDEYCIARIENDLDKKTVNLFEFYLQQHPEKLREYNLYCKTILKADKRIVYNEKRKLKHFKIVHQRIAFYRILAVAATITLMFLIFRFNSGYHQVENKQVFNTVKNRSDIVKTKTTSKIKEIQKTNQQIKKDITHYPDKIANNIAVPEQDQVQKQKVTLQLKKNIELSQLQNAALKVSPVISEYNNSGVREYKTNKNTGKTEYLTLNKLAEKEIKKVLKDENLPIEKEINLWTLAKSGIIGINKLIGSNIVLDNSNDTTTNRNRFEINTGLLGFYTSSENK
jgi:hypothetical protein